MDEQELVLVTVESGDSTIVLREERDFGLWTKNPRNNLNN